MVKRRFSALFLTLTLLLCTLPAAAAEGDDWLVPKVQEAPAFTDMAGVWCADAVDTVCAAGLMQGRSDGSFGPDDYITRAQVMALVNEVLDRAPDADYMLDDMIVWPWMSRSSTRT